MQSDAFAAFCGWSKEAFRSEVGVFHLTYFTLEQLHSEALLGFFTSSEGIVYACEGRAEKNDLQQRSITDGVSKTFFFFFSFIFFPLLFGHWEFSYVSVCFESLEVFRIKRSHHILNRYIYKHV